MTRWISWGFDAARLGTLTCTLTETGGGGATGAVSMSGQYMHHIAAGTYTTEDPITGESETADTGYTNFAAALETALNAIGNATYYVVFDPDAPGYTITATGGSVTAFALTSISTSMQRALGINEASLSGALSYDCTDHADGATNPLWGWTAADIGFSEWTEAEEPIEGEDLVGADGDVRGLVAVGTPRRLDFVVPWEAAKKIWNTSATSDDWTWQRALARARTVEPCWIYPDPRDGKSAVVCYLRRDACTLAPRMASADYLGHQSIPVGAWVLGRTSVLEDVWVAYGWTAANYYQGPNGSGRGQVGTVRLVGRLESLPAHTAALIASRWPITNVGGWRIDTGQGAAGTISGFVGGTPSYVETPRYTFGAGDVGDLFVLHMWLDGGGHARLAINGAEVGSGSASTVTTADAGGTIPVRIGNYNAALPCPYVGVIDLSASATAMSLAEIAVDADIIISSAARTIPTIPGQDMHFNASDIAADGGDWHDRDGDNCTLTEYGTVTLARVT